MSKDRLAIACVPTVGLPSHMYLSIFEKVMLCLTASNNNNIKCWYERIISKSPCIAIVNYGDFNVEHVLDMHYLKESLHCPKQQPWFIWFNLCSFLVLSSITLS